MQHPAAFRPGSRRRFERTRSQHAHHPQRCGRDDSRIYLEEPVRVHLLALFLCVCAGAVAAEQNRPPRLIAMGCNFDGGLTWLALGKARAGSELDSFRVEIPDVDLERVDATISPSNMDMFMPYGQGPVVGPINVSRISIAPRTVDGVRKRQRGHRTFQHPIVLFDSDRFFAAGRDFIHFGSQQQEYRLSALTRLGRRMRGQLGPDQPEGKGMRPA